MSDASRPDWVGQRAVAWVLDEAPVPAELAITLVAIARRCDEHGRGSCQSEPTLAEKTGKSKEQVHRDIVKLLAARLILPGDPTLPERLGIPAGKRPAVYDVNLALKGPKPSKASKNKSGKRKDPIVTPGMEATPSMHATPGMEAPSTPSIHATPTPSMHATQTKPLNNPLNNPSSCNADPSASRAATTKEEEGEEILNDQQTDTHTTAANIANHYRPHITAIEARRLTHPITDALNNGWTVDNIRTELDADHTGLANLAAGLITRARTMAANPPPPPAQVIEVRPDAHPFQPDHTGASCEQCRFPRPNIRHRTADGGWVAQSPADRAVAQAAALAARYAAEDGTGNPFQPVNHRSSSYRPWRGPDPAEYERPL